MYRTYENPWTLEDELERAEQRLAEAMEEGDDEQIMWAQIEVHELRDRVNFAWQDEEYDENYAMVECGEEAW